MNIKSLTLSLQTFVKNLFKSTPRSKPEKIWCFYPEPYKKGLAATGVTGGVILTIIALVFLVVAIITLILYILAGALSLVAAIALIALAVSGAYGFKENGKVGIIGLVITIWIASSLAEPVFGFIEGIWELSSDVGSNLAYLENVYAFISSNILLIIGIILAPAIAVLIVAGILITIIYSFISFEKLVFRIYKIRNKCPECSRGTEPADYRCGNCKTAHPVKLMPSQYGVFSHECINCGDKMPTMLLSGNKKKLPHNCPHADCKADLNAGVLGIDKHIAFVGGAKSGKTCLLVQATQQLLDQGAVIPEKKQEQDFIDFQKKMLNGEAPPKTQSKNIYRAFQLEIKKARFPYHLHFYDIAGENFEDSIDAKAQKFFSTLDSIVFVFDPFYSDSFRSLHKVASSFEYASRSPLDIMRNLIQALEKYAKDKSRIKRIALNVVLVKTDIGYLNGVVYNGMKLKESSEKLKQFMLNDLNEGAFIQLIGQYFSKINFHYTSALGRIPSPLDRSPFVAENLEFTLGQVYKEVKMVV